MKKIYIIILFALFHLAKSQTGNVGINTTNPIANLDINGTFKAGQGASVLNSMVSGTATVAIPAFAYNNATNGTVTVTNVAVTLNKSATTAIKVGANIILNPTTVLPNGVGIAYCYVTANNTLTVAFITGFSTAGGNVTFNVLAIQ